MKITVAQEVMLFELAEKNKNPENEWAISGRGKVQSADSLVRLGLAKRHERFVGGRNHVFSLTLAGWKLKRTIDASCGCCGRCRARDYQRCKELPSAAGRV